MSNARFIDFTRNGVVKELYECHPTIEYLVNHQANKSYFGLSRQMKANVSNFQEKIKNSYNQIEAVCFNTSSISKEQLSYYFNYLFNSRQEIYNPGGMIVSIVFDGNVSREHLSDYHINNLKGICVFISCAGSQEKNRVFFSNQNDFEYLKKNIWFINPTTWA